MSREIRFRAWDTERHQYVTDYDTGDFAAIEWIDAMGNFEVRYKELDCHCSPEGCGGCTEQYILAPNVMLEQFTGLTDSNGVEIYEGDIITEDGVAYAVEWFSDEYAFAYTTPEGSGAWLRNAGNESKVIGNIHEHSHLLNTGDKV